MIERLRSKLAADRRPPDGLLHPSSDITGSLRHTQLRAAGAPTVETNIPSEFRMMLGTLAHKWFEEAFRGTPVMQEVRLDGGLPEGWSGTADALFWDEDTKEFLLVDLKTTKAEGIPWIERDGIKHEHHAQASAYWMAAKNLGLPMREEYAVLYMPIGQMPPNKPQVKPLVMYGRPDYRVWHVMEARREATETYLDDLPESWDPQWLSPNLAEVQSRVQKLMSRDRTGNRDVLLVNHWSAAYCPFPDEICNCNTPGTNKIGTWVDCPEGWIYSARKGYEEIEVTVAP